MLDGWSNCVLNDFLHMHKPFASIIMFHSPLPPIVQSFISVDEIIVPDLLSSHYVLGIMLCTHSSLSPHNDPTGGDCYCSHFTDEEVETQEG